LAISQSIASLILQSIYPTASGAQLRLAAEKFFVEHSHEADEYMRNIRFVLVPQFFAPPIR
jgi:hypothetical protein